MSNEVVSKEDTSQFLRDLWEIFENLPSSSESAAILFESSAFRQVAFVSIQNAPYAFPKLSEMLENSDLSHFLSTRFACLESCWISIASFVHNLVMAIITTGAVFVTVGVSDQLNRSFHKHLVHTSYAAIATVTSVVGVVSPYLGLGLNAYWGMRIFNSVIEDFRADTNQHKERMVRKVRNLFEGEGNREFIHSWLRHYYKDEDYNRKIKPSLEVIEKRLEQAKDMRMVVNLITDIRDKWPNLASSLDIENQANGGRNPRTAFHQHYRTKRFWQIWQ